MTLFLIAGGALVVLLLVIGVVVSLTGEDALVEERLGRFVEEETVAEEGERSSMLSDWVNEQVERTQWGGGISRTLAQANLKLRPGEYVALIVISVFGTGLVTWFVGGRDVISGLIGVVVGFFLPRFYVNRQRAKRLQAFNDQLPDMLSLMVNGLRAGFSPAQAMEAVSREMPPPMSEEFRRVVREMQLGISMPQALDNLLRRIPSDDLDLVVTAINVQREVGGNLAEILDTIAYTIRERIRIKGEIRVLTAQVMYSGRFLALLPFILSSILWFANRPYLMSVFQPETRLCGIIIVITVFILVGTGYFIMMRIADIEV
ncbi:MAG: secretion system protein [Anaerolineae bacterium]|nr:MAG: secretion system protein [Anaerolineae bacterium]